ncbi:MAG: baseplate J/gp47 family protein [Rhodoferax sp.]|nr:baseplate J/gp47 family protein [Rhodoferax sp.]
MERPTLKQLIDQGATEFESRLPGVLVRLRIGVLGVLNRVIAGALSALYKYAERLNKQVWPDTCDQDELPKHGTRWNIPRIAAAAAKGIVQFTGVNGVTIPAGSVIQRSDEVQYTTDSVGTIAAGVALVPVTAALAGQLSNAVVGTQLTLTSTVSNVNALATVATELSGGADVEEPEHWRERILSRIRKPPQGGNVDDYVAWALQVPGVTRAWVYPKEQGAGSVVVRFVRDDDASPIPDAAEVTAVQQKLDFLRPVTANLMVVAPAAVLQNFAIQLMPDTVVTRAKVTAELADLYRREAVPGGTMLITHQREAISIAEGETDHVLVSPSANQVHAVGQLPMLGAITWL